MIEALGLWLAEKGLEGVGNAVAEWAARRTRLGVTADHTYTQVGWNTIAWTTTAEGAARVERFGLFLRLRLRNSPRKDALADVVVSLHSVGQRLLGSDRYSRVREDKYPKPLVWSYTARDGRPADTRLATFVERERLVDLGMISEPPVELEITTEPKPRDNSHKFGTGAYRFGLVITGVNFAAIDVTADVELLGAWDAHDAGSVVRFTVTLGKPKYEELFERSIS